MCGVGLLGAALRRLSPDYVFVTQHTRGRTRGSLSLGLQFIVHQK